MGDQFTCCEVNSRSCKIAPCIVSGTSHTYLCGAERDGACSSAEQVLLVVIVEELAVAGSHCDHICIRVAGKNVLYADLVEVKGIWRYESLNEEELKKLISRIASKWKSCYELAKAIVDAIMGSLNPKRRQVISLSYHCVLVVPDLPLGTVGVIERELRGACKSLCDVRVLVLSSG